jgi:arsenite-transporting ATPase
MQIDAHSERRRFMKTRRGAFLQIIERGTYLEQSDVEGLVDLAVPGIDELAALFRLIELARDDRRLVIDTAPTGHTLRLLDLPATAGSWLAALRAMDEKHRVVAEAFSRGTFAGDEASGLIDGLEADLARIRDLLADPDRTRFVLVTNPEPVVLAETRDYRDALERREIGLAGIVVNRSTAEPDSAALGAGMAFVPPLTFDPRGADGLRRFAAAAVTMPAQPNDRQSGGDAGPAVDGAFVPPLDRQLYLVAGKGGAGKSTAAAALAVLLAERGRGSVLLLGVDPAGSLGDVLGADVDAEASPVAGIKGLAARQLDAGGAWRDFQARYRRDAERLFAGIVSGAVDAGSDRQVVERLIDMAPPGIDELVALLEVVDLTEDGEYDAIVLDTAPTGHLLRLLELPELALEWTATLLRLLLKYREVVGLGELGERVLRLSRELRGLRDRLADPASTWVMVVALPESLSIPETARLTTRLTDMGMKPGALLVNRALGGAGVASHRAELTTRLIEVAGDIPVAAATDLGVGPVGVERLREFAKGWRSTKPFSSSF